MNFNVRLMITAKPANLDKLMKAKMLFEKKSIEEFGKENVHCTRFFTSEEYNGFYLYINIPEGYQIQLTQEKTGIQPIELKEVEEDANHR